MAKNASNQTTGGDVIAVALKSYGISTGFCLAGTAHTYLLKAMDSRDFRIVSGRHETATVAAADGFARVTGRLGVAMIKADQGLPNAMTGILTAQQASSPVVVLASMTPASKIESTGEEANDILDMVKPYVKWARTVPTAERLEEFVHTAARYALTGRPGVAVLGIPQQFEAAAVEMAKTAPPEGIPLPDPKDDDIAAAADLLAGAKRPMIVAGSGAALSGAGPALRKLVKSYNIPILANALGRGLVPEDLKVSFSWPLAQIAAKEADVVLALGVRLTERLGFGLPPRFNPDAKFIQVDIIGEQIGRNRPVDVPVVGDAARAVEKLHKALKKRTLKYKGDPAWVNKAMTARMKRISELGKSNKGPIHPYRIARDLMSLMPKDAIYVGDGADIQNWMHGELLIRSERSYMDHYPVGSMGIGTPLALGAAAGARELAEEAGDEPRPVVLVTGDGSFGFYCSELNGAVMAGLKLIVIISNDGAWGTEKHGQANALGTSYNCELGQMDYQLIGQAYGARGVKIEEPSDLKAAIKFAFESDTTTVLNVLTDPEAGIVRKQDPRVQTIAFEDLVTSLKTHYTPEIA